jgi:ApaG protein
MTTYQFKIEATPTYLSSAEEAGQILYHFAYSVTFTNTGSVPAQLISRHWIINDAHGHTEEVKGLGVIGHQPLLNPGESFQYASGSRMRTSNGTMHGSFFFVATDGHRFDVPVPLFVLEPWGKRRPRAPCTEPLHIRSLRLSLGHG